MISEQSAFVPKCSLSERQALEALVAVTGHEKPGRDIRRGLEVVLEYADLKLDTRQKNALSALLDELQYARRFRGEPTFADGVGEESGTHSLQVARMIVAVTEAASARLEGRASRELVPQEFVRDGIVASCIHDMGELFGEFSTVRERAEGIVSGESSTEKERLIFVGAAMVALQLAESGRINEFGEVIRGLRENVIESGITLQSIWDGFVAVQQEMPRLSGLGNRALDRWIALYDATENLPGLHEADCFTGTCVKIIEQLQGSLHFCRFAKRPDKKNEFFVECVAYNRWDPSQREAYRHSEQIRSKLIMSNLVRIEGKLGRLFELAQTDWQKEIAGEIRDKAYSHIIEYLDAVTPLVKRSVKDGNPQVTEAIRDAERANDERKASSVIESEYYLLLQSHRETRREYSEGRIEREVTHLNKIETRARLKGLYMKALEVGYVPRPGQVLALGDEIPETLRPFKVR